MRNHTSYGVFTDCWAGKLAWFLSDHSCDSMGLSLNIDMSSTSFIEPLTVIDTVIQQTISGLARIKLHIAQSRKPYPARDHLTREIRKGWSTRGSMCARDPTSLALPIEVKFLHAQHENQTLEYSKRDIKSREEIFLGVFGQLVAPEDMAVYNRNGKTGRRACILYWRGRRSRRN
ncbi:hypothetical protein Tco_0971346 [Tanacetum coccineum]